LKVSDVVFDDLIQLYKKLPENLDLYLAESESKFEDITANTDKKIIWHSAQSQKTNLSFVYIHGYSATRQEISPLVENLAMRFSANAFFTRLSGHGRSSSAMTEITLEKLLIDTVEAFRIGERIGERVVIVANSTGATLATWLAATLKQDNLAALILLSPNYGLQRKVTELLTYPFASRILPLIFGKTYQFEASGELQEKYWTTSYPTTALIPMMSAVKLARHCNLQNILHPVFFLYSEEDGLLDIQAINTTFDKIGSEQKSLQKIESTQGKTHHVLAGDIQSPATTGVVERKIVEFLMTNILCKTIR